MSGMTLDQMLALLADNTTGQISAADLRTIVTDLYHAAHSTSTAWAYKWTADVTPPDGRVTMDQPWQMFATKAYIAELTDDGITPSWSVIDNAVAARVWFTNAASQFVADITGRTVDRGTYRDVPIAPVSLSGATPVQGDPLTVSILVAVG